MLFKYKIKQNEPLPEEKIDKTIAKFNQFFCDLKKYYHQEISIRISERFDFQLVCTLELKTRSIT